MKPFDYYSKHQTAYPYKQDYIKYYVYDKGEVLWTGFHSTKSKAQLEKEYPDALIQVVVDEEAYKAHKEQYSKEEQSLHKEFVNDLFENFNVMNNPKKDKAFALAWERGHSSGFEEVYNEFYDLVDLIQDT